MSNKMTDRLDNQKIIELARNQYETQKRVTIPPVIVKLPSNGLIYPKSSPLSSGMVEIRHMTAYDEDILTNTTYIKNKTVFDKLLESILVTPGVHPDDISATDRESLIISARIFGYGNEYPVLVIDPSTNQPIERIVDLSKLSFKPFDLISDENGEFDYTLSNGDKLKFRFITYGEFSSISDEKSISDITRLSIAEINGMRDKNYIDDYVKYQLIASAAKQFRNHLSQHMPGINYEVEFEGEDGSTFISTFQLGSELFWF